MPLASKLRRVFLLALLLLCTSACAFEGGRRFEETRDETGEVIRRATYERDESGREYLDGPYWEFKWPLIESGSFVRGKREGPWVAKLISGEITYTMYLDGEADGLGVAVHPNGQVASTGWFKRGLQDGHWRRWDTEGVLIADEWWRDGQRTK